MIPIKYVIGDATEPQGPGRRIIAHVCNDMGAWGAGFVLALSAKDAAPMFSYRDWYAHRKNKVLNELNGTPSFGLGEIMFTPFLTDSDVFVCNMIAQNGQRASAVTIPLNYEALRQCLSELMRKAVVAGASVHMPRIGCGLAGGTWDKVAPIIQRELSAYNVPVTVYDLLQNCCRYPLGFVGNKYENCHGIVI